MRSLIEYFNNPKISSKFFVCVIAVCLFWIIANVVNIYSFAITGAVFEILWLPMLALTFLLSGITIIMWIMQKFRFRSFYLYSLLAFVITFLLLNIAEKYIAKITTMAL